MHKTRETASNNAKLQSRLCDAALTRLCSGKEWNSLPVMYSRIGLGVASARMNTRPGSINSRNKAP